ncbi:MAG: DUF4065 domain-containing protein [Acidimicrobiia bacterium]|nr:DUF4065 domain-containing protein [Acidimicrobiia bacterium]
MDEVSTTAVSAHDIAAELRRRLRSPGVVKIHKLLYYCQGLHLAWTGRPMFAERIEAWVNGPVVADLWTDEKHGRARPDPHELDADALATIEHVLGRFGSMSGKELIRLTHAESPWRDLSESEDPFTFGNPIISNEALVEWFGADGDVADHEAEVARLRARSDIYTFESRPPSAALVARVAKVRREGPTGDRRLG